MNADETQVIPGRRTTKVRLADGNFYSFAELPASMAMAARFADALHGSLPEFDDSQVRALHSATKASLVLGGMASEDADDALWLIDLTDKEVVSAVMAAVFPRGKNRTGSDVASTDGGVR